MILECVCVCVGVCVGVCLFVCVCSLTITHCVQLCCWHGLLHQFLVFKQPTAVLHIYIIHDCKLPTFMFETQMHLTYITIAIIISITIISIICLLNCVCLPHKSSTYRSVSNVLLCAIWLGLCVSTGSVRERLMSLAIARHGKCGCRRSLK